MAQAEDAEPGSSERILSELRELREATKATNASVEALRQSHVQLLARLGAAPADGLAPLSSPRSKVSFAAPQGSLIEAGEKAATELKSAMQEKKAAAAGAKEAEDPSLQAKFLHDDEAALDEEVAEDERRLFAPSATAAGAEVPAAEGAEEGGALTHASAAESIEALLL